MIWLYKPFMSSCLDYESKISYINCSSDWWQNDLHYDFNANFCLIPVDSILDENGETSISKCRRCLRLNKLQAKPENPPYNLVNLKINLYTTIRFLSICSRPTCPAWPELFEHHVKLRNGSIVFYHNVNRSIFKFVLTVLYH